MQNEDDEGRLSMKGDGLKVRTKEFAKRTICLCRMLAKTEETRNKRMATAIEWIAEGKQRNWKYMKQ